MILANEQARRALGRREFFKRMVGAGAAVAGLGRARYARAEGGHIDGDLAHEVPAPPSLTLSIMNFEHTPMYNWPSSAVVGVPTDLAPGERRPLVVLLPGGHHNQQPHHLGRWGWWSEYLLGDVVEALGRQHLALADFRGLADERIIARFNRSLESLPFRGMVLVTPWCVGRQLNPAPHGAMVAPFLRQVVERARQELPVLDNRECTGIGGMSSGGLWALHAGSACADLFSSVVATQPFTEELLAPLRAAVRGRSMPQRLRMVTSYDDHQREPTEALSAALTRDGIEHELIHYPGAHSAQFAQGPGGLDAVLTFDRWLRGFAFDGTRPLPVRDGMTSPTDAYDLSAGPVAPEPAAVSRDPSPAGGATMTGRPPSGSVGGVLASSAFAAGAVVGVAAYAEARAQARLGRSDLR